MGVEIWGSWGWRFGGWLRLSGVIRPMDFDTLRYATSAKVRAAADAASIGVRGRSSAAISFQPASRRRKNTAVKHGGVTAA